MTKVLMKTVRKSNDGNVLLIELPSGFAVKKREAHWQRGSSQFVGEFVTVARGLSRADADAAFAQAVGA